MIAPIDRQPPRRRRANSPIRESVTTIRQDGSRFFLHPSDVRGKFTWARRISAVGLIAIYAALPWIQIGGYPAVFLDVLNRRFHLFGLTFAAQDVWMAFFFITGLAFSLYVLSALFGRIWCGWACPQTIFLEHIFRRIERWIDGDARARRRLEKSKWTPQKIAKRLVKHGIFLFVSSLIAHLFLSYFLSIPQLYAWMAEGPDEHWQAFVFMFVATGIIYFNFSWFREQLCLIICPYGRLQSALVDDDTLVVGYDEKRGEPRGPLRAQGLGDCINCNRCVNVCPTGIDIRQGLQIECIGCAACVDACNDMMKQSGRAPGLVRYDSYNGLQGKKRRFIRPRVFLYAFFMLLGVTAMTVAATQINPAYMAINRMGGAPYISDESGVRNQFFVRVINKENLVRDYTVMVKTDAANVSVMGAGTPFAVEPMAEVIHPIIVTLDKAAFTGEFELGVTLENGSGEVISEREIHFVGPDPRFFKMNSDEAGNRRDNPQE